MLITDAMLVTFKISEKKTQNKIKKKQTNKIGKKSGEIFINSANFVVYGLISLWHLHSNLISYQKYKQIISKYHKLLLM